MAGLNTYPTADAGMRYGWAGPPGKVHVQCLNRLSTMQFSGPVPGRLRSGDDNFRPDGYNHAFARLKTAVPICFIKEETYFSMWSRRGIFKILCGWCYTIEPQCSESGKDERGRLRPDDTG